jgi:hypothetical protein
MSPLLLGAAWLLFVISCFASMTPTANSTRRPRTSSNASSHATPQKDDQPL